MNKTITAIIINYNTPDLTLNCLNSIKDSSVWSDMEVVIIDNNSVADSREKLSNVEDVRVIFNTENVGFAGAVNQAGQIAETEYLLLINSDLIVEKDTIGRAVEFLNTQDSKGILGIKLKYPDGKDQNARYYNVAKYTSILKNSILFSRFLGKKPEKLDGVMGAFMLIPKEVFQELNGFDPDFFLYAEELDFCRRARLRGYPIYFCEDAVATHIHGGSSESGEWALRQAWLSTALLYLKSKGTLGYGFYHFLTSVTFISNLPFLWRLSPRDRANFSKSFKAYLFPFISYLKIPFLYSRKFHSGRSSLKLRQ